VGIFSAIFGASRAKAAQAQVRREEGFVDFDLPLAETDMLPSGARRLVALGMLEGQQLGFAVEIHPDWKAKPIEDGSITFYWGRVTLRRSGAASDAFVTALSKLYASVAPAKSMLAEINAQAVGLGEDPRKLAETPAKMKLFFHSEIEARYAEVFPNVDLSARLVQFREKDPEYRENLVRALSEHA